MIKQMYVCQCDICGVLGSAIEAGNPSDIYYTEPKGWKTGVNSDFHICPECAKKLNIEQ